MTLDYWEEQIKATLVMAAHLAVPATYPEQVYLPVLLTSYRGQKDLGQPNTTEPGCSRHEALPEER